MLRSIEGIIIEGRVGVSPWDTLEEEEGEREPGALPPTKIPSELEIEKTAFLYEIQGQY